MKSLQSRWSAVVLFIGGVTLCVGATGCALRASTDFGPGGDEPAHRSVSAGAGPFRDLFGTDRRERDPVNE